MTKHIRPDGTEATPRGCKVKPNGSQWSWECEACEACGIEPYRREAIQGWRGHTCTKGIA